MEQYMMCKNIIGHIHVYSLIYVAVLDVQKHYLNVNWIEMINKCCNFSMH